MSTPSVRRLLVVVLLLDVFVFGWLVAREEWVRRGATIKLPVEGYDPRDLLSGHYVAFLLVAEREADALNAAAPDARFGISEGADGLVHVTQLCTHDTPCERFLQSRDSGLGRLRFGIDRFYVDERKAHEVARVSANSETYLIATVDRSGDLHAVDLVINGVSIGAAPF